MIELRISEQVRAACPQLVVGALACRVCNPATSDELWAEVEAECRRVAATYRMEDINKRPAIQATRQAYKAFGKDPNRYRPSAESLCRRAVKGLPLYRISALVDIINIVSMRSGFSIGGFDADRVQGGIVTLGVGTADDVFEGNMGKVVLGKLWQAYKYNEDMEAAHAAGEVAGRNETIETRRARAKATDGLPDAGSGTGAPAKPRRRIIDTDSWGSR